MFSSTEEPSLIKIRERQLSFGRLMLEINRKIAAGDSYASILSFLFDCLDKLIPYDRIGVALIDGERLCSKWMKSKLPGGHLDIGYCATGARKNNNNISTFRTSCLHPFPVKMSFYPASTRKLTKNIVLTLITSA